MPGPLVTAAFTALVIGAVLLRPARATALLVFVLLLVPATLAPPPITNGHVNVLRFVAIGVVVNLVARVIRGELGPEIFWPTPLQWAFVAVLMATMMTGLVAGPPALAAGPAFFLWTRFVDQMVVLVALVAGARASGDHVWLARTAALAATAMALVALCERVFDSSWSAWLLSEVPSASGATAAQELQVRGGAGRVRVAAPFALSFAWVAASLFPLLVAEALRRRHLLGAIPPALLGIAMVLSLTRSVYLGAVLGMIIFFAFAGFTWRALGAGMAVALVLAIGLSGAEAVRSTFDAPDTRDSSELRVERLPLLLEAASDRPFTGGGLGALTAAGISSTDSSYLRLYAETGALGTAGYVFFLATAVTIGIRRIHSERGQARMVRAAALGGVGVIMVGGAFTGSFTIPINGAVLMVLAVVASLGTGAAAAAISTRRIRQRAALASGAVVVGLGIGSMAPTHAVVAADFETLGHDFTVRTRRVENFASNTLVNTTCEIVDTTLSDREDLRHRCFDLRTPQGLGSIRVEASQLDRAQEALAEAGAEVASVVGGFRLHVTSQDPAARPNAYATLPVWLGLIPLLPSPRRGRDHRVALTSGVVTTGSGS